MESISLLLAQYEALSILIKKGWRPRRTVILAHGFDEETTGRQGARKIAPYLESVYGKDSMLMLIDEGDENARLFGTAFALPATTSVQFHFAMLGHEGSIRLILNIDMAWDWTNKFCAADPNVYSGQKNREKGYLDVLVRVGTPGGHSSIPPQHTSIGIISETITAIEAKMHPPNFDGPRDPILRFLICASQYGKTFPKHLRRLIDRKDWSGLGKAFAREHPANRGQLEFTITPRDDAIG